MAHPEGFEKGPGAGAEVGPHIDALVDGDLLGHGHDAQHHHAVHMGVGGLHLVGLVEVLNEELLPELLGGVALNIAGRDSPNSAGGFPP